MRVDSHLVSPCAGCFPVLQVDPTAADAMTKRQNPGKQTFLHVAVTLFSSVIGYSVTVLHPPGMYHPFPRFPILVELVIPELPNRRFLIQDGRPPAEDKLLRELQQPREDGYIFQIRSFL